MKNRKSTAFTSVRSNAARRGFTLLEMTAVIGIIMALLAMAVIGYRYVEASAARNRTRVVLQALEAMTAELDRVSPQNSTQQDSPPGDVSPSGGGRAAAIGNCSGMMTTLLNLPANQNAITQIPAKCLVTGSGSAPAVLDGWGNPVIYVHGGGLQSVNLGMTVGSSGTPQVTTSKTIQSPDGRGFWASAGPDANFTNGDDNVYSFEK